MLTWVSLAITVLTGVTLLIKYLLSDKRKIAQLKARQYELEEKLRRALAVNDTVAISSISIELERVRTSLASYPDAK
jgi:heme exporter protein D